MKIKSLNLHRIIRNFSSGVNADFSCEPFSYHKIDENSIPSFVNISREEGLKMFHDMRMIRSFELKAGSLYKNRDVGGFCHLSIGQEACNVGLENSIAKDDVVVQSYRMHGIAYMRGHTLEQILGELCGKKCGSSKGKGGSMHYYGTNLYGGYGIVGSQVPIGAGIGWAMKYRQSSSISIALYGDGAANQGQVFEAFNMAKLYNCPTIFICENNNYGMGTSIDRSSAETNYYVRGQYIPGVRVDGQDLISIIAATRFAADWCRSGKGPILLEYVTYRFCGHSVNDPGLSYRTRDEVKAKQESSDPIGIFGKKLIDNLSVTESELDEIAESTENKVDSVAEKILESENATAESLYTDIYKDYVGNLKSIRGRSVNEIYHI